MQQIVAQINCLAAKSPRIVFAKLLPSKQYGGTNYLYRWLWSDTVTNGVEQEYRALSVLRTVDPATGPGYWARVDGALAEDTDTASGDLVGVVAPFWIASDLIDERATYERGSAADSEVEEGILCKNNHGVQSLVVQDCPIDALDIQDHTYVAGSPRAGDFVLGASFTEAMRGKLQNLRASNLPIVVSWAAVADGASYKTTALATNSSSEYGIRIDDTSYRNVLDSLVASATYGANTPGWQCHQYLCGVGDPATTRGSRIKVMCRVLADASTSDGTVRFETPQGNCEITVSTAGGLDWYGTSSDFVYLDSTKTNDDVTANRNKVDVCAKAGASGTTYVYGIRAWVHYE